MQLKYELDNTKKELVTLHHNWRKKKEETLSKMQNFRTELKEKDAVMVATEHSYTAYCALAQPLLNLGTAENGLLEEKLAQLESMPPVYKPFFSDMLNQVLALTPVAEKTETMRVERLRDEYKYQAAFIQQKSKEIYQAMNAEKKSVEAYANLLEIKIQDLNEQFAFQTSNGVIGQGL